MDVLWSRDRLPTMPEAHSIEASDFVSVLKKRGALTTGTHSCSSVSPERSAVAPVAVTQTQATTVLAFKFADGVMVAGDRRATAGNIVMYDRADKVLEIDRHSVMAIAGSPATAWEMARILEHSFQFYRRSQLQEMSVEGKVRALSKLLRDNLGMVIQGLGVVVPLFATFDAKAEDPPKVYFYDAMGAQFEATDFAASGSGGPSVRSILYYENTWGKRPLRELDQATAITVALRALDTASEADTATGGIDRLGKIFPVVKVIGREGIQAIEHDELASRFQAVLP
jgi:proteasome beta subunit